MNCSRIKDSLHSYLAGDIEGLEKFLIEEHLKKCNVCKEELEQIKTMEKFLKGYSDIVLVPQSFATEIMDTIDLKRYRIPQKSTVYNLKSMGVSLVCAGIMLFVLNSNFEVFVNSAKPMSFIDKGLTQITGRIMELDGITGRIENKLYGGMENEL